MEAAGLKSEVRSDWRTTLIVCGKCSRKLDGGFGPDGRSPLGKALRRYLGLGKGRKARLGIVESECLGICPKGAVVAIDAAAPATWRLVRAGTKLHNVADMLGVSRVVAPETDRRAVHGAVPVEEPLP